MRPRSRRRWRWSRGRLAARAAGQGIRSPREHRHRRSTMLNGQIALVTGASRGIGAAIAARLAEEGARVIGTATTPEGAARIGESLAAKGGRGAVLDVASQESIDALIEDVESKEGAITILVNNAGITRDMLLLRMKAEDWSDVIDTNLASVFRLSKAVLRGMMKARKGRIVNITSVV